MAPQTPGRRRVALRSIALGLGLLIAAGWIGTGVGGVAATDHSQPVAVLSLSPNPAHPDQPVLIDASDSTDPDGEAVTCEFDLDGDGQLDRESADCTVETAYAEPGDVPITVVVTDPSGQTNETTETLRVVENRPPSSSPSFSPAHPDPGEPVELDGTDSTDPDGTITGYRWDVGGGGPVDRLEGPTPTLTFDEPGEYDVSLTVVDDDGATGTATTTVAVEPNRQPIAALNASPAEVEPADVVTLSAAGSSDPDGRIVEWAFDLDGDGGFDEVGDRPRVRARYSSAGEYEVSLRVTDDDGATALAAATVVVVGSGPTAARSPAPVRVTRTETVVRTVVVTPAGSGLPAVLARLGLPNVGLDPVAVGVGLVVLGALVGAATLRRRAAVRDRATALARRIKGRLTPRKLAARLAKKVLKKGLRKAGEAIEHGGEVSGRGVRSVGHRIGDGVERVTRRVGRTLKRWGR